MRLAFGEIHIGGLDAGSLKNVPMSLGYDPHPVVHFSVLSQDIAASLLYSPFISSTLGMLCKLYTLDTHESEGHPNSLQYNG